MPDCFCISFSKAKNENENEERNEIKNPMAGIWTQEKFKN
jgi:hypothetical protein